MVKKIKYGYCHCGCGEKTNLAKYNDIHFGWIKKRPYKFIRGHHMRIDKFHGEKSPTWKGDNVGYSALHGWVKKILGKPNVCSKCRTTTAKRYEWANISGKYKRNIKDFKRVCTKCHRGLDYNKIARGERQGSSKLTKRDIIKIRKLYIPREYSISRLARQFNVSNSTIHHIIIKRNWKHI